MSHLLFPQKLHKLLDDNRFEEIISWQPHGRSFKVHQRGDFMKKVYPIYFNKTVKYPSFQRQLSYYGFRRQELPGPDKGSYYHPHFMRGCFSLCTQQVYRHVERAQEVDENALPCYEECSRDELAGGLKMKSLHNKQGSNGPEPMFYSMTPLPSLPNQKKRKADNEEFNTRRSHRDHLHPFMIMMGPDSPLSDPFRSDTNENYPRYGHKDGWKHEVSDCYSAPYDGRQHYHDTSADLYHNPYEHHIMMENETTSSLNKETRHVSTSNGYYSYDSHHGTQFNDYDYTNYNNTVPIPPVRSRNIPTGHLSFIPNCPSSFRGDKKREDQSSSRNSNASTFDDERDPIKPVLEFPSCSSRSLNESHSTMIVPGAARMSDPPLLAEEEDADIFGHRPIEEKVLLDEARLCINRDSFDWDDTFSFSFSW